MSETRPVLPGVKLLALCEPCGTWQTVELMPMDQSQPITNVHPVCWVCRHAPLVLFQKGRIGGESA